MASVAASHFVSRSSYVSGPGSETTANLGQIGLKSQSMTHNGLRSLNMVDKLQFRTQSFAKKSVKKAHATGNDTCGKIVCQQGGMDLVFVATEVAPWSKTGGLGDVLGGLPPAMAARGHRVMTISPRFDQYKDAWDTSVVVQIQVGNRVETVRYYHCYKRGVDRVFVDHPMFLEKVWGKTGSKIYGPAAGEDYQDNLLRFSLFCLAALEAPRVLSLDSSKHFSGPYGEDVVFVANDWHTGILPCYLKSMYQSKGVYMNAKVVFCIHNIAYQGRFAFSDFSFLNLPDEYKSSFDFKDGYNKPVKGRKINWLKAGVLEAHRVMTVSPYYAQELVSGEEKGVELDNYLRISGITGIVNGMDVQEWNPATDKYLSIKYEITTVLAAKPLLKEELQAEVGLPVDRDIPVIGFIGRLEEQKGSDILAAAIPMLAKYDMQIVVLGTGKKYMEKQIAELEKKYPDKVRGVAKFNVPLAHMIIAGADFMLIPSRFEPCGLIQLHAMRYGTVCIVSSTGGLVDTVKEGYTGFHMGPFNVECDVVDQADVVAIVKTVSKALAVYGTAAFKEMIKNCMSQDLSWKGPARLWEKMLLSLNVIGNEAGDEGEEIAPLAKENVATP
ncbi:GRANULE-BOUND STARCH SYNTHASE [Salix purpurea]|uniref:Granule-bound starch synthase 1, chloroplastic/amyloplastic n=1 Tax=Salix purpurea TaxID=77065 RepID=A0A9Q1A0F4_SALPP|nr:GRANULE-BOUND STARCH SYNTHASE [Salix purpurea]KAJ6753477.1 GRANULE-BOUND STARCH SYNTHASE [Salix purpurea]KAJ6753478.1 GRANULE-BOUND STARCH SYNTHASE [Salix purpurea]KAJ6753479.1 GRANULE-BOUND STARCH SYNTHASE [Salix purpurea]